MDEAYLWKTDRGLEIVKAAIQAIEYDEDTKALLSDVKKADALSGARGNSFMQQSVARGFQAAGENPNVGGVAGMAFMGMGANAVGGAKDGQNIITLKCTSCGAEVVIDTSESTQARCHWCRNTLSINQQIPNGAVPDVVLPFKLTKAEAREQIETFVGKRKFFAHPTFRQEFTTENIMGVYFPYMIVDINSHAKLTGQGEHKARHVHEKETKKQVTNLRKLDNLIRRKTGLENSRMEGANNTQVRGSNVKKGLLHNLNDNLKI